MKAISLRSVPVSSGMRDAGLGAAGAVPGGSGMKRVVAELPVVPSAMPVASFLLNLGFA